MTSKIASNLFTLAWVVLALVVPVLISTCHNSAITYAHSIDPRAACSAIVTTGCSEDNTAECTTSSGAQWTCYTPKHMEPFCVDAQGKTVTVVK